MNVAIAIAAHPDDIEFCMAGTLLLLKQAAWKVHYLTIANGSCGSIRYDAAQTRAIRRKESQQAAKILGAHYHSSLVNDLEVFYDLKTLRRLTAILRGIRPSVILTHSPQDYMEDHTNTCRLAVTAAFARGMPNFATQPPRPAIDGDVAVYHAMPHGLRDGLRRRVVPEAFVDTSTVHETKRQALAAHRSQEHWLDLSQGMGSYLKSMDEMSFAVGKMSKRFKNAEGWRRHSHLGFSGRDDDPMREALSRNYAMNQKYRRQIG